MNEIFVNHIAMIQADLAYVESLLPSGIVCRILDQTEGSLDEAAVVRYKSAPLFSLRNGWLWHGLRRVLMPVRMMRRSLFSNSSGLTVFAVLYTIVLSFVWMLILSIPDFRNVFFGVVWTGIILSAISPRIVALLVLLQNKTLYAGAKRVFSGEEYYGKE